jgi:membrane protein implicated in regulation of membrane protease activity
VILAAQHPSAVLALVVLAALLLMIEAAPLPTFGAAAALGVAAAIVAGALVAGADMTWWPLLGVVAAVASWGVMLARRKATPAQQGVTLAMFGGGAFLFGALAGDAGTALLGLAFTVGMAFAFPRLFSVTQHLLGQRPLVGMDAHVGDRAVVVSWDDAAGAGTVRLAGSLWSATSDRALAPGAAVVVTGYEGMTLRVGVPIPTT